MTDHCRKKSPFAGKLCGFCQLEAALATRAWSAVSSIARRYASQLEQATRGVVQPKYDLSLGLFSFQMWKALFGGKRKFGKNMAVPGIMNTLWARDGAGIGTLCMEWS